MRIKSDDNSAITNSNARGISSWSVALLSLLTTLMALALPFSLLDTEASTLISWTVCIAAGVLLIFATKKFSSIIVLALVLTFVTSYADSPSSVALVTGTIAACGIFSAIVSSSKGWQIPLIILSPAVASAVTFLITRDVVLTVIAISPFPPSLAMGITTRRGGKRTSAIAAFALVAVVELIAAVLSHIYIQNGYLSFETISHSASYFWSEVVNLFTAAIKAAGNVPVTDDILLQVRYLATELTNLLVGIVGAIFLIIGFFAQKIQISVFERFDLEKLQNNVGTPIRASVIAAIVYTVAHIFSYTSSASSAPSFVAAVGANVSLILLPLLLCVGFEFIVELPRKIGFLALVVWLGAVIAAYFLSSSILNVIALVGAFYTVLVNIDLWAEEHYRKGED